MRLTWQVYKSRGHSFNCSAVKIHGRCKNERVREIKCANFAKREKTIELKNGRLKIVNFK